MSRAIPSPASFSLLLSFLLFACSPGASRPAEVRNGSTAPSPALPMNRAPGVGAELGAEGSRSGSRHLQAIGIQLYTVRAAMAQDFAGTLRTLASLGYQEVEFAGLFGHDPSAVRQLLAELKLVAVGSHVAWERFRDDPDGAIEETLALGSHYLVFPHLPTAERRTLAQWRDWVALLNRIGQSCQARGLELAYHNHDFEFAPLQGVAPYDLLLEQIDRNVVKLELDLFWLAKGGREPGALFESYPGGFPLGHIKDLRRSDQAMVDVGAGDLDFAAVFGQAERSGMRHFIVEHDNPADPLRSAANSLAYLQRLSF